MKAIRKAPAHQPCEAQKTRHITCRVGSESLKIRSSWRLDRNVCSKTLIREADCEVVESQPATTACSDDYRGPCQTCMQQLAVHCDGVTD